MHNENKQMRRIFSNYSAIALFVLLSSCEKPKEYKDWTSYVHPISEGGEGTALSIYDTNPESPDGKYICCVEFPQIVHGGYDAGITDAHVMIKTRKTGEIKKIYDIEIFNHNGANAQWVNDTLVAFHTYDLYDFVVFDVKNDTIAIGPIDGELGHKSFDNELVFTYSRGYLDSDSVEKVREKGIYKLDCITGSIEMMVSQAAIVKAFTTQNPEITGNDAEILHVEPNPRGDKILFDYRHQKEAGISKEQLQGFVNADGSDLRWVPERPMHVVWYDNETMFGVDTKDLGKRIYRYDLHGKKMELLGGRATHVGTSPDRQYFVGESAYYQEEDDGFTRVYIYKKGSETPLALLAEWDNGQVVWDWKAHVNPSFSADGKRLYFIRTNDEKASFEAVSIDIGELW